MRRRLLAALAASASMLVLSPNSVLAATSSAASALADTLSFEWGDSKGVPAGWYVWRAPLVRDTVIFHAGSAAARIDRNPSSIPEFSAFSRRLDADFAGDTLEIRGWLRTQNVEGYAGLWLREDGGKGGVAVEFDNMEDRKLQGTTAWSEYRVSLPLDSKARTIVFGGLLAGTGTVWLDEIQLLVDGRPVAEAPRIVRKPPPAETDHEFDGGSRVSAADLAAAHVENLALLGRVWGFLKYHHRDVAQGKRNWDYELFRVIPSVAKAKSRGQAEAAIVRWIDRVGMPPECRSCAQAPRSPVLEPPIAWIHDTKLLGKELSARLVRVHRDRPAEPDQYYVAFEGAKNPDFSNEASYKENPYPDAGYRLLALYRFWNVIAYWFPYRDVMNEDWNAVLAEFIPRVIAAKDPDDYRLAMIDLVSRVHDTHANVWDAIDSRPPRGECWIPAPIRIVGDRFAVPPRPDSLQGAAASFRAGDVILAIDGMPVDSLVRAWAPHYGASNDAAQRRDIGRWLVRGPCGACRVTLDRGRGPEEIAAVRDSARFLKTRPGGLTHDLPGPTFRKLADDVAYLKLSSVVADSAASYVRRAAGTRCLVIDIRNYPSQFVVFALGQHLVDRPTPFAKFTRGDGANPGAFVWTDSVIIEPAAPHYSGKVVILVDEVTQSSAEYTSMAFRSVPGSLVVGSTTAGADGNVSTVPLPGGINGRISGIGVFYPDGRPTQRVGIVPDLVVHPTVEGIRAGRDEVLEAALEAALGRVVRFSPGL
jgi:C-terminal processing protease CtpA/Prc